MPRRQIDAATLGQGFMVWALYELGKRIWRPVRYILREVRRAVFGWREYPEYLREQSIVEGIFNGSKGWLSIGAVMWGVWAWRKGIGRHERVVLHEVLEPGSRLVITQVPRKVPRKQRRAAAKSTS
jgi:hypothetical protein